MNYYTAVILYKGETYVAEYPAIYLEAARNVAEHIASNMGYDAKVIEVSKSV